LEDVVLKKLKVDLSLPRYRDGRNHQHDDGTEINSDLVPKPGRCLTCRKDDAGGKEEILCLLTRNDQKNDDEFECGAYEPK
jgi:hypothetical protein